MWVTIAIVAITYIGVAIGRWPLIKSNRATIVMIGVGLLLATRQINFEDIPGSLDFDTLILLFAMMVINANLKLAGFFDLAGRFILRTARTPRIFLAAEILLVGILSALFLNDTICLVFTPFLIQVTQQLKRNPIPYLIALATASNVGSVATLTGNPQNMIIGISSGISYLDFAAALAPISLLGLLIIWLVLIKMYPFEFKSQRFEGKVLEKDGEIVYSSSGMLRVVIVVIGLLVALLVGVQVAPAAFIAACILLITRRHHPENVFSEFNWGLLVFFSGMFVVSNSLEINGVTTEIFLTMPVFNKINIWNLSATTGILSNLVSNVPAVLLLRPIVSRMAEPHAGWLTLAAISTLAGNLTLLGSVANLIVAEIAQTWRVDLNFWEYTRTGVVITAVTMVIGMLWLNFTAW